MFFETSTIAEPKTRREVETALLSLHLKKTPTSPASEPSAWAQLDSAVVWVSDVDLLRKGRVHASLDRAFALGIRPQVTFVALISGRRDESALKNADLVLHMADHRVLICELKSMRAARSATRTAWLQNYFREVLLSLAPERIRAADFSPTDEVLWVEFADGLRRAFKWSDLPFSKAPDSLMPRSVRVSEHHDALLFSTRNGATVDVDSAALRAIASDDAAKATATENQHVSSALGTALRMLRAERGVSQEQLAVSSGLPQPTISRIEHGEREPRLGTLEKYARGLGMTLNDVLDALRSTDESGDRSGRPRRRGRTPQPR